MYFAPKQNYIILLDDFRTSSMSIQTEELSLAHLWLKLQLITSSFWRKKFSIIASGIVFGVIGYIKVQMAKPSYSASITFSIIDFGDEDFVNSLASQFGTTNYGGKNLDVENLTYLLKSRRIVQDVLMSPIWIENDTLLLIDRFLITQPTIKARWDSLMITPFLINECLNTKQDSAIGNLINVITNGPLTVDKHENESLATVSYSSNDPVFTLYFVELLVQKAAEFQISSKLKIAHSDIQSLVLYIDSVSKDIEEAMYVSSSLHDKSIYTVQSSANITLEQAKLNENLLLDLYGGLFRNLEISKTLAAQNKPLLTIIDRSRYPLIVRESPIKSALKNAQLGSFVAILFFSSRKFLRYLKFKMTSKY